MNWHHLWGILGAIVTAAVVTTIIHWCSQKGPQAFKTLLNRHRSSWWTLGFIPTFIVLNVINGNYHWLDAAISSAVFLGCFLLLILRRKPRQQL